MGQRWRNYQDGKKDRTGSAYCRQIFHRQHSLRDIYGISFEVCETELMALLLECAEIKKLWLAYNRALKRFEAKYDLFEYECHNGYRYLAIGNLANIKSASTRLTANTMT